MVIGKVERLASHSPKYACDSKKKECKNQDMLKQCLKTSWRSLCMQQKCRNDYKSLWILANIIKLLSEFLHININWPVGDLIWGRLCSYRQVKNRDRRLKLQEIIIWWSRAWKAFSPFLFGSHWVMTGCKYCNRNLNMRTKKKKNPTKHPKSSRLQCQASVVQ